jgi:tetratricopeptide (TPR) repeat protein
MNLPKKLGLFLALLIWCALSMVFYWNIHLYYSTGNKEEKGKIAGLERGVKFFPFNDHVFYELGKTYFDMGLKNLQDRDAGGVYLAKAVQNLKKSVMINPASPYGHFFLGQSLLNLSLVSSRENTEFVGEFRKAAELAGEDSQIFKEVGTLFLSRWPQLSEQDRNMTTEILQKITGRIDHDQLVRLLSIWALNVTDYSVIEKIFPENARIYRQYAEFLGERSLSLEERHTYLAKAEQLEFSQAKQDYETGENLLLRYRTQGATDRLSSALSLLQGIRFYQTIGSKDLISNGEYQEILKMTLLDLAKARIEGGTQLSEISDYLRRYLTLEDRPPKVAELETYLRDRKILPARLDRSFDDLPRLAFELLLLFKQSKYREIVTFGRDLGRSLVIVPQDKKKEYINILLLIGDSQQKIDFLYDADDFYQKALDVDPNNLGALLRVRQNCSRLNEEKRSAEVDKVIEKVVTPKFVDLQNASLNKGELFSRPLVFDGRKIALDLHFMTGADNERPLLAVFFNHRVVWEAYLKNDMISLTLDTEAGENELQIFSVNRSVALVKFIYSPGEGDRNSPISRR